MKVAISISLSMTLALAVGAGFIDRAGMAQKPHQHHQKQASGKKQPDLPKVPPPSASAAKVPKGYYVQVVIPNLTYPTSIEFDPKGNLYVAEAGEAPGDENAHPRVIRQWLDGQLETIISDGLEPPVTDLLWHQGKLYVSHRGKISTWSEGGKLTDIVTGLPSLGDHHNNQMSVGPDGKIYFGQGTATNSGVVGEDNHQMGWLKKTPYVHDEPANDIVLAAPAFKAPNPFMKDNTNSFTSPFQPFSKSVPVGTRVKGTHKAGGTILRMNPDGSGLEVYAWGLRNPYGIAWSDDGKLYASENGMDERGSRPIANDKEDIYLIRQGAWYGWPDFAGGEPVTLPKFRSKGKTPPQFLMANHPAVEKPLLQFDEHSAITQMEFSRSEEFGRGDLFVAFFGHMTPMTGETPEKHAEHRVARINLKTMKVETFFGGTAHSENSKDTDPKHASSQGKATADHKHEGEHKTQSNDKHMDHAKPKKDKAEHDHGEKPAEKKDEHPQHGTHDATKGNNSHKQMIEEGATPGPRRLIDVRFSPRGDALYVVDFGAVFMTPEPRAVPGSGVVWRIIREEPDLPLTP